MLKQVQHDTRGQAGSIRGLWACGHAAFTMAEILLSLTIIGVVAAITLPSLTGNINERTWNTQRKALYARFSQAIALMPALNGYGTVTEATSSASAVDTAAETFITDGLAKVLKINNICDNEHLADCGIVSTFTNSYGSKTDMPTTMEELNASLVGSYRGVNVANTKAAAFETQNGESIAVIYNPNCVGNTVQVNDSYSQPKMCANFIYDLNGNKGPNTFGKDIGFITALYASDSVVVAPHITKVLSFAGGFVNNSKTCRSLETESRIPNLEEVEAIFYNQNISGIPIDVHCFWSSTHVSPDYVWGVCYTGLVFERPIESNNDYAVCVKRN